MSGQSVFAYVGGNPVGYYDLRGLERKPGKTPPKLWPAPPDDVCGKKPRWNPEGFWDGKKGRRLTWDDRSHGAGQDRGNGPQGGHWDDETSDNRWDSNGQPLPGSPEAKTNFTSSDLVIGIGLGIGIIVAPEVTIPLTILGGAAAR